MKNTIKYTWLISLLILIAGLSTDAMGQRRSSRPSMSRPSISRPSISRPSPSISRPSSQMGTGGTMGSGINSKNSTSSQMKSGGTMGSGIGSGTPNDSTASKMKPSGAMNSNPKPIQKEPVTTPPAVSTSKNTPASTRSTTSTTVNKNPATQSGSSTQYRYRTYSGPRETSYNGRQVYVNVYGGYSYYPGGPVIAYMPGFTPVPVVGSAMNPWYFGIGILVGFIVIVLIIRALMFGTRA